jgi:uncharacterized protein
MSANLLAAETSPYLLQHKDNPVHWMSWGEEALARARAEDKPILLSVGYAACHWCHVMAHECFEDADIAALMNRLFVNVKVDREERPDIDAIYQTALALLGEHGGWPLTMFLTPDGEPFSGGTYFPPEPRYGRPGLPQVLSGIAEAYRADPTRISANVSSLRAGLARLESGRPGKQPAMADLDRIAAYALTQIDPSLGGLRGAPKFPQCALFEMIWRAALRNGDAPARNAILVTCERICQGGVYDHLGGGFARYSTDPLWLVPHFEKMLYDNAQLVSLLTLVWQSTATPLFATRVAETVDWVLREMRTDGGAFAASLDADSEGAEGKFYVWSEAEIEAALGDDAQIFKKAYDVSAGGNWDATNVLNRLRVPALDAAEEARLPGLRARLLAIRAARPRPGWDDKVLADWNGMMIAALAKAGFVFDRPDWIAAARQAYDFIRQALTVDGRLVHSYRLGRARHAAMLDDYANMARAALALAEAGAGDDTLDHARAWLADLDQHYWEDEAHGYCTTADDAPALIARTKSILDSALPAGNAVALEVIARLHLLDGDTALRQRADQLVEAFAGQLDSNLLAMPSYLNSVELLQGATQVILVGDRNSAEIQAFLTILTQHPGATTILSVVDPTHRFPTDHPAAGKGQLDGRPTAYVCHGQSCSLPITETAQLTTALAPRSRSAETVGQ